MLPTDTIIYDTAEVVLADKRIRNISYSSLLTLHACPRKFQLEKLNSISDQSENISDSVTYAYGHVVGLGLQCVLEGKSRDATIYNMFNMWTPQLLAENEKQKKSIFHAIYAVDKFTAMREQGYLEGYSLASYEGKPACELSFTIALPNGFLYRGFVDAVLVHEETGNVIVLEVKTSSATSINSATYKNSAQAIGYSIVLDSLFPALSSYEVIYLVYSTKSFEYTTLPFTKSYLQRARWIQELLLDVDIITMYEQRELYPMRGESCYDYYRECSYMNLCQMSTDKLTQPLGVEESEAIDTKNSQYQINISMSDLITTQLSKL